MIIRSLLSEELAFAPECTALEGWAGETLEVFEGFHGHDPGGCLVAEEGGALLGICVATSYGGYGFIGELIVRREGRGRGIGPKLLESAVHHLRERGAESIGLDGVARAVPFYELSGFRTVCRSLRFSVSPGEAPRVSGPDPGRVRPMSMADLPSVRALDREAFGADRSYFLERKLASHPELAWIAEGGGGLAGFILGHPGNGIVAVGPWVVAERWPRPLELFDAIRASANGLRLRVCILETNAPAVQALRSVPSLAEEPPSLRMILGPSDRLGNSPMCWAVGSPAKG
jgi:ribosomal protein S18 acetylase RimI-like enzyme